MSALCFISECPRIQQEPRSSR